MEWELRERLLGYGLKTTTITEHRVLIWQETIKLKQT